MSLGAVTIRELRSSYPRGRWRTLWFVVFLVPVMSLLARTNVGVVGIQICACRVIVRLRLGVGASGLETALPSSPSPPATSSRPAGLSPPASEAVRAATATAMRSAAV